MAEPAKDDAAAQRAWAALLRASDEIACLRVDRAGRIREANAEARAMLGAEPPPDLGHAFVPEQAALAEVLAVETIWRGKGTLLRGDDPPIAVKATAITEGDGLAIALQADFEGLIQLQESLGAINSDLTNLMRERAKQGARLTRALAELEAQKAAAENQKTEIEAQNAQLEENAFAMETALLELDRANQQLQEMDRLKSRFYANMNHELRTPLNSILGFAEDALDGLAGPLTPDLRQYFETIHSSGQRQLALVTDILDIAKLQAGHVKLDLQDLPVVELVRAVEAVMRPLFSRKRQAFEPRVAPGIAVRADDEKLHQVLLNLVSNAHKYTPEEGRITLTADRHEAWVRIRVADTGIGIPPDDLPLLFDEFHQVRRRGLARAPGTGLGLAITKSLTELHGGRIEVESTPGAGSTFTLLLPPASGADSPDAPAPGVLG